MPSDSEKKRRNPVDEATKETTHHCEICNKYYASYKSYGNHVRSYHSKNKEKSKCPHCGNCFTRRDNLQQHIKLFHGTKDGKFKCKYCANNFHTKHAATKHQRCCLNRPREHMTNQKQQNFKKNKLNNVEGVEIGLNQCVKRRIEPPQESHSQTRTSWSRTKSIECCSNEQKRKKYSTDPEHVVPYTKHSRSHFDSQVSRDSHLGNKSDFPVHSAREDLNDRNYIQIHQSEYKSMKEGDKFPELLQNQSKHLTGLDKHGHFVDSVENGVDSNDKTFSVQSFDTTLYNSTASLDTEESMDRALDCISCNITFLTKHDYHSHKPFCHEMAN